MSFNLGFVKKYREIEESGEKERFSDLANERIGEIVKELSGSGNQAKQMMIDKVIAFTNVSGGTGATTIAHNVAYEMVNKGLKVILIDMNITMPNQHLYLDVAQEIQKDDLVSWLLGKRELSKCIVTDKSINLLYCNNRTMLDEINCQSEIAIGNFYVMIDTLKEYYDCIILDCPMRPDVLLYNHCLFKADNIYIVIDDGINSIVNLERARRNMALSGLDCYTKARVIMNKKTSVRFTEYPFKKLNIKLVEVLPFDDDIIDNSLKGQIFCESGASNSKNAIIWAQRIQRLTSKILNMGGYIE